MSGTDRQITQETIGEGFAYHAWHRYWWPESHSCQFSRGGICWYHWTRDGGTRR